MNLRMRLISATALSVLMMASINQLALSTSNEEKKQDGAALLEKEGCLHCHYVGGKGGFVGPPFEGIEKFRSEQDIVDTLTKKRPLPPEYPAGIFDPREFMRHVKLNRKTAEAIAKYLVSIPDQKSFEVNAHGQNLKDDLPGGFTFEPKAPTRESRMGFLAYKEGGCAACHEIGGIGGRRGPSLDGVGARLSKNSIANRITTGAIVMFNEKEYRPTEYSMPPAQLPKQQVDEITEFLLTLPLKKGK